jgi:hypothetical protein
MAEVEVKDFISTPYYELYNKRINDYCVKVIKSTMQSQGIDDEKKYTWGDVLKEVYKFVNVELRKFPNDLDLNPTRTRTSQEQLDKAIEEQAKQML